MSFGGADVNIVTSWEDLEVEEGEFCCVYDLFWEESAYGAEFAAIVEAPTFGVILLLFGYGEEFEWIREWVILCYFGLASFSFPED